MQIGLVILLKVVFESLHGLLVLDHSLSVKLLAHLLLALVLHVVVDFHGLVKGIIKSVLPELWLGFNLADLHLLLTHGPCLLDLRTSASALSSTWLVLSFEVNMLLDVWQLHELGLGT